VVVPSILHSILGQVAPFRYEKRDDAVAEYGTALRLKPDYAEADCNLGHALREQGRFVEALLL